MKTVPESIALSPELRAHHVLRHNYNKIMEQNLQILYLLFSLTSLILASSISASPGSASFQKERNFLASFMALGLLSCRNEAFEFIKPVDDDIDLLVINLLIYFTD